VLDITVLPPTKTESLYEFRCNVRVAPSTLQRIRRRVTATAADGRQRWRFGYRTLGWDIRHHEIWDGFYPLFFLTRRGGPLFATEHDRARIRFSYPISESVRDFFIRRARELGEHIEVEAELADLRFDGPTDGHVLAFGGGKDSRLILGLLRETGVEPTVITTRGAYVSDVPGALEIKALYPVLTDRIMSSFMHLGRHLYFGTALGEAHLESPWHGDYDIAATSARRELSALFDALGAEMHIHAPVTVLPYNLIQWILSQRYPGLYAHQSSTRLGAASEKSLHIALLRLYRGLDHTYRIDEALFEELLAEFVTAQLERPNDFGVRNVRELVHREMRGIIWRKREHPVMAAVGDRIPAHWDEPWIDYIHTYADPGIDPAWLAVYREYAATVDEAEPGVEVRRFRT